MNEIQKYNKYNRKINLPDLHNYLKTLILNVKVPNKMLNEMPNLNLN